jgi:predicted neutral ceramidase superfamily lipid hydrolase
VDAVNTAAAIGLGVLSGALVTEAVVLVPYWRSISPESFTAHHDGFAPRLYRYFAPLTVSAVVLSAISGVVAVLSAQRDPAKWLTVASSVLATSLLGFYRFYFEAANRRLPSLARLEEPDALSQELRRWQLIHQVRTGVCVASFACAVSAL